MRDGQRAPGGAAKTDTYPSLIGGNTYDPQLAWASNFRGSSFR
ncbi:hypothetical protein WME95_47145 [Sorangium sp. So ce327]